MPAEYYTYFATHTQVTINPSPLQGVEGRIVTFSGPSGAGKTTITEALHTPGRYEKVGKLTTREQRKGNSREQTVPLDVIHEAKRAGDFLYWEYYGATHHLLPVVPVLDLLLAQTAVLLETPTVAARALKEHLPDQVTTIFVDVPDTNTLISRMRKRGDPEDSIQMRWADMKHVYDKRSQFDVVVYNPDVYNEPPQVLYELRSLLESV